MFFFSVVNPIWYGFFNENFKQEFNKILEKVQVDQLNMVVAFWYLGISYLSSFYVYTVAYTRQSLFVR